MSWTNPPSGINPQHSSFNYIPGGFTPPPPPAQAPQDQPHRRGVPGGGWDQVDNSSLRTNNKPREVFSEHKETPPTRLQHYEEPLPRAEPHSRLPVSEQPGVYERKLLEDLTLPGGARPRPSENDLKEFSSKCKYLQCETVMGLLLELLELSDRSLKVLYVIDRLVSDYDSFKEAACRCVVPISCANYSPLHMKVLQPLLSKLGTPFQDNQLF